MDKNVILIIGAVVAVVVLLWIFGVFSSSGPVAIPGGNLLFYGTGCPHCKNVDEFIEQNGIASKVSFKKLEVWYNRQNQAVVTEVAKKCGINPNNIGVPLLYDGSKCYEGDINVINFFKNAAGVK